MATKVCKHNNGIDCSNQHNCDKCGWNPAFVKAWLKEHYDYPTPLDIVSVVRCKDCVYANLDGTKCYDSGRTTKPNGYCDRGERVKTNG